MSCFWLLYKCTPQSQIIYSDWKPLSFLFWSVHAPVSYFKKCGRNWVLNRGSHNRRSKKRGVRRTTDRGAPTGGGIRRARSPLGHENTIFSRFLSLNYANCIFEVCFLKSFAMWEDWGQGRRHGFSPVGAKFPIYIVHCVLAEFQWGQ